MQQLLFLRDPGFKYFLSGNRTVTQAMNQLPILKVYDLATTVSTISFIMNSVIL